MMDSGLKSFGKNPLRHIGSTSPNPKTNSTSSHKERLACSILYILWRKRVRKLGSTTTLSRTWYMSALLSSFLILKNIRVSFKVVVRHSLNLNQVPNMVEVLSGGSFMNITLSA